MHIFASRQCADYVHVSHAGEGEACVARATFVVGSCFVSVVSKPQ